MTSKNMDDVPSVNLWQRMLQIWTNTAFIKTVIYPEKDKTVGRTWLFWFVWNTLIAIGLTVLVWFVFLLPGVTWVEDEWWNTVPDFEVAVNEGVFSTNLPQPYILYNDPNDALVVIDTEALEYSEASLVDYPGGVVISADKIVVKDETREYRSVLFSEFEEDVSLTKNQTEMFWYESKTNLMAWAAVFIFIGMWVWLCLFRLLTALWWAWIFWSLGALAKVPNWNFTKSYMSVLNFYTIPLVFELGLLLIGVGLLPLSTLLVFSLVFGVNFYAFKDDTAEPTTR
jgi:hypothetical protein